MPPTATDIQESRSSGDPSRAETGAAYPALDLDPQNVRNGLGQLVLTVVELVRELMERQALRRVEAGSVTDDEAERLGLTFMRLSDEVERLREHFGLEAEDLNLDLGPLGKLL